MRLHGAIDLTQIKQHWRGKWDPSVFYKINDVVKYRGQSFVCVTTDLYENRRRGYEYKPTESGGVWKTFSHGYLVRGTWEWKSEYYPGNIVKYNGDWYLCEQYNFGGHPIYEDGGLSNKWKLIGSTDRNKASNHIWMQNYNPMGWTKNHFENDAMQISQPDIGMMTIDGNYCPTNFGSFGDFTSYGAFGTQNGSNSILGARPGFNFWDYYDGNSPGASLTGGIPKCIQICKAYYGTYYLFDNGELYSVGYNGYGQLGDGTITNRQIPVRVGYRSGTDVRGGGTEFTNRFIVKVVTNENTYYGSAGSSYATVLALDSEGDVWAWGYNACGQTGNGSTTTPVTLPTKIERRFFDYTPIEDIWCVGGGASYTCSFALDKNGQLWAWGYNDYGQLGNNAGAEHDNSGYDTFCPRPSKVALDFTKYGGIKKFKTVHSTGTNSLSNVLTNDGQIWSWGYSAYAGPLFGIGSNQTYRNKPQRLAKLIWDETKLHGEYNREIGNSIDMLDNVDDFWHIGKTEYESLVLKEKGTGTNYGIGYFGNSGVYTDQQTTYPDRQEANYEYNRYTVTRPTPLNFGNFTDLKMVYMGTDVNYATSAIMLNGDGRALDYLSGTTGGYTSGRGFSWAEDPLVRNNNLPWERDYDGSLDTVNAQIRGPKISMMMTYNDIGMFAIANNNRLVYMGSAMAALWPSQSNGLLPIVMGVMNG